MNAIDRAKEAALNAVPCTPDDALEILHLPLDDLPILLAATWEVRKKHFGISVDLCSIINAKNGRCGQDCAFCAQSAHHHADIAEYPLIDEAKVAGAAQAARNMGAGSFSIVTSGLAPSADELGSIRKMVSGLARIGVRPCVSLGILDRQALESLGAAGLHRVHHNLESASSFYPGICSTRQWSDNLQAVLAAKDAGLKTCSGGIFGMGETDEQRVELALQLRDAGVDKVPLNFLHPIPGTPLQDIPGPEPFTCLKIIAAYRLFLPDTGIVVCGGRDRNLGYMQNMIFHAGASGMMIGNYLTTSGRDPLHDLEMIRRIGLEIAS